MPKQTTPKPALTSYEEIFRATSTAVTLTEGNITEIPLDELYAPEDHPFLVKDDDAMSRLTESVKQYGVREPGLARPRQDGGYELIAGNRRKRACELAGIPTLPVIIREMDDDSAAIAMVDSNLEQRETLLYSEKAWAYRVKMEALNHRGIKSDVPGQLSVDILCEQTGESKNQIYRLVRLTELVPDLLDKVDVKKLAFTVAEKLSHLTRTEQAAVVDAMAKYEIKPSLSQATKLKKLSQDGELSPNEIDSILSEDKKPPKPKQQGAIRFREYFPSDYSEKQMEAVVVDLLTKWKAGAAV